MSALPLTQCANETQKTLEFKTMIYRRQWYAGLLASFFSITISVIAVNFYKYDLIRYAWLFIAFWVCCVFVPRFFLELLMHRRFREIFFIPAVIVIFFSICYQIGVKIMILGLFMGTAYTLALLLANRFPTSSNQNKKRN